MIQVLHLFSKMESFPLENLFNELLVKVFSFLSWSERIKLESVNRRFFYLLRTVATRFPTSLGTVVSVNFQRQHPETHVQMTHNAQTTTVSICCPVQATDDLERLFRRIPAAVLRVSKGRLDLTPMLKRFLAQHVRKLEICQMPAYSERELLASLPQLERLIIDRTTVDLRNFGPMNLQRLYLNKLSCSTVQLYTLIQNCPMLCKLALKSCLVAANGLKDVCVALNLRGSPARPAALYTAGTTFAEPNIELPGCRIEETFRDGHRYTSVTWENLHLFMVAWNEYDVTDILELP